MRRDLFVCLVVAQILLYTVYAAFSARYDISELWGDIPPTVHGLGVVLAIVGYLSLLVALFTLCIRGLSSDALEWTLISAVMTFFMLQIMYVPFGLMATRREIDKSVVRAILILCVVPVAIVAGVAAQEGDRLATVCGAIALMHYTAFDAIYYGFCF